MCLFTLHICRNSLWQPGKSHTNLDSLRLVYSLRTFILWNFSFSPLVSGTEDCVTGSFYPSSISSHLSSLRYSKHCRDGSFPEPVDVKLRLLIAYLDLSISESSSCDSFSKILSNKMLVMELPFISLVLDSSEVA